MFQVVTVDYSHRNRKTRKSYPVELIFTGISFLENTQIKSKAIYSPVRSLLVYTLIQIKGKWLPLNREYKPLGLCGDMPWVDYKDFDFLLIDPAEVKTDHLNVLDHCPDNQWFFSDLTYPRDKKTIERYIDHVKRAFL